MAGFSQDLPTSYQSLQSRSPQSTFQHTNITDNKSLSSSSEMNLMRNYIVQMQRIALISINFVYKNRNCKRK